MATEFTVTIKPSGGDFTSWNAAIANTGIACDFTAATTKVFGITSVQGTPGASLTGQSSSATATLVKVNVAQTQALLKSIAGGPFIAGETVQSSAGNSFVLTNAGTAALPGLQCSGMQDTTQVVPGTNLVTDATHYLRVYAAPGANAQMPYDTSGAAYRLELTPAANQGCIQIAAAQVMRLEHLQIKVVSAAAAQAGYALKVNQASASITCVGCYFLGASNALNTSGIFGVYAAAGTALLVNCVATNFDKTGANNMAFLTDTGGVLMCYGCSACQCAYGYRGLNSTTKLVAKNCLFSTGTLGTTTGFTNQLDTTNSTNNASTDATCPGSNPQNSATFTFVNAAGGDYHLAATDAGALRLGADLRTDATYPVATDFDGKTRYGTPSIGAFDVYGSPQRKPGKLASPRFGRI